MARPAEAFPVLLTRRLRLRPIETRDASALHAFLSDPETMRFWDVPASRTMADTERMMAWLAKTTSPYDHLAWAIADRPKDRCIGMVNYHHREARNRRLELGYVVARQSQGQGYGAEAVRAVLDYCVGTLGVHRVQAFVHPENRASIRLVEGLGFRCEGGPLADYWRVGDSYRDAMLYAFVAPSDHKPRAAAGVKRKDAPRPSRKAGRSAALRNALEPARRRT
jgi:ribosomal-protein-alanine N-acetyltransferase